jgi:adenylate kinase
MEKIILIFGNTSSGKSFLGKNIEMKYGLPYLSFGDLKREEINKKSSLGLVLQSKINNGMPINPKDGFALINKNFLSGRPAISLSGYPISEIEYSQLTKLYQIVCGIYLKVSEETMRKRFFNRGVCPICHFPGSLNSLCPIHNLNMIRREDATYEELNKRMKLFNKRINPFIELATRNNLFPLKIYNSEFLDFESIYSDINKYLE